MTESIIIEPTNYTVAKPYPKSVEKVLVYLPVLYSTSTIHLHLINSLRETEYQGRERERERRAEMMTVLTSVPTVGLMSYVVSKY
jgi:hypothetical protein